MKVYIYHYENNSYDEEFKVFSSIRSAQNEMKEALERVNNFNDFEGRNLDECIQSGAYSGDNEWMHIIMKEVLL